MCTNGQPARDRADREHARAASSITSGLSCARLVVVMVVRLAVEGHEDQPPGIERGQRRGDDRHDEAVARRRVPVTRVGRLDDRVLGEKAGGEGKAGERQRADHHHRVGERDFPPQPAHVAHVLLVVHGEDHRAGAEEQQRLEEGVGEQVEHADRIGADAHGDEHVAELRAGRIGDDPLDVVLHEADGGGEHRRGGADER